MGRTGRYLVSLILLLAVLSVGMGVGFIAQGVAKANLLTEAMRQEQVTYGLPEEEVVQGNVIDTAEEAQKVGDTVREHRRNIAATYEELLGGGRYDPNNPQHLSYAQAMNMENYLYLAVAGLGLTTAVIASGAFMMVVGIAIGATGLVLRRLTRGIS